MKGVVTAINNGTTTIDGVSVDKNISNQIMFGCNEMRINIEQFRGNIFATLVGYNFGPGGVYWCICKYVAEKYNYTAYFFSIFSKFPYFW